MEQILIFILIFIPEMFLTALFLYYIFYNLRKHSINKKVMRTTLRLKGIDPNETLDQELLRQHAERMQL